MKNNEKYNGNKKKKSNNLEIKKEYDNKLNFSLDFKSYPSSPQVKFNLKKKLEFLAANKYIVFTEKMDNKFILNNDSDLNYNSFDICDEITNSLQNKFIEMKKNRFKSIENDIDRCDELVNNLKKNFATLKFEKFSNSKNFSISSNSKMQYSEKKNAKILALETDEKKKKNFEFAPIISEFDNENFSFNNSIQQIKSKCFENYNEILEDLKKKS